MGIKVWYVVLRITEEFQAIPFEVRDVALAPVVIETVKLDQPA